MLYSICMQVLSCRMNLNHDLVLAKIWEYLGLVRAYTKPRGKKPGAYTCMDMY